MAGAFVAILVFSSLRDSASAEQPDVFEVFIPAHILDLTIPSSDGVSIREAVKTLTVYADGERCTSVDLATAQGDAVLPLGLEGQPDACSRDEAVVTFIDGDGRQLNATMELQLGTREALSSFATAAPTFDIVVPANVGAEPVPNLNGDTIRASISPLTAYVDGVECLTFDISDPVEVVVSFGIYPQPPACFNDGGIVTLKNAQGFWLSTWFTLERSSEVILDNLAPIPPCEPCTPPGPAEATATPAPPGPTPTASTGTRPITPPDTGSAGLLH